MLDRINNYQFKNFKVSQTLKKRLIAFFDFSSISSWAQYRRKIADQKNYNFRFFNFIKFSLVFNYQPNHKKSELRNKLEIPLLQNLRCQKYFATIEKYDNENYHKIIEKLVSSATKAELMLMKYQQKLTRLGATFANNYFQKQILMMFTIIL